MDVYGIRNCSSVINALRFLDYNSYKYNFIDLKKVTLSYDLLFHWLKTNPDALINKRSKTYRLLKQNIKDSENDLRERISIIQNNPTLIKRPILVIRDNIIIGFNEKEYINIKEIICNKS